MSRTLSRIAVRDFTDFEAFAAILNDVATQAITTNEPSQEILKKAQQHIAAQGIRFR